MKRIFLLQVSIWMGLLLHSQIITSPGYGLVSHETMSVTAIEYNPNVTIVSVSLENRTTGGYFCVDRNTFMVMPDGSRLRLVKAEGIPYCPDVYRFSRVGERIAFRLYFPVTSDKPDWFDLVEECDANCFSVIGITTSQEINDKLDLAYRLADSGKPAEARVVFIDILEGIKEPGHGIVGSLYSNIILMCLRDGNEPDARKWYEKLIESGAPHLNLYIENLAARGIKW